MYWLAENVPRFEADCIYHLIRICNVDYEIGLAPPFRKKSGKASVVYSIENPGRFYFRVDVYTRQLYLLDFEYSIYF